MIRIYVVINEKEDIEEIIDRHFVLVRIGDELMRYNSINCIDNALSNAVGNLNNSNHSDNTVYKLDLPEDIEITRAVKFFRDIPDISHPATLDFGEILYEAINKQITTGQER